MLGQLARPPVLARLPGRWRRPGYLAAGAGLAWPIDDGPGLNSIHDGPGLDSIHDDPGHNSIHDGLGPR